MRPVERIAVYFASLRTGSLIWERVKKSPGNRKGKSLWTNLYDRCSTAPAVHSDSDASSYWPQPTDC